MMPTSMMMVAPVMMVMVVMMLKVGTLPIPPPSIERPVKKEPGPEGTTIITKSPSAHPEKRREHEENATDNKQESKTTEKARHTGHPSL